MRFFITLATLSLGLFFTGPVARFQPARMEARAFEDGVAQVISVS